MRRLLLSIVSVAVIVVLMTTSMRIVRPGEHIVIRRFGRVIKPTWGPGLHWGIPFGIDRFDRVRTDEVRLLDLGMDETLAGGGEAPGSEFLTGDLNLIRARAIVQYRVDQPADFLVRSVNLESVLRRIGEASLSSSLARRGVDSVLRSDRQAVAVEVEQDLRASVERHNLGMSILSVSLIDARPPSEVAAEFSSAQSAESQRDRRGHEARSYAETTLTAAKATAQAKLEHARGASQSKISSSRAQAERFLGLLTEARRARSLTVHRVYMDSMQSLLNRVRRKVVLPPDDVVDLTVLGVDP